MDVKNKEIYTVRGWVMYPFVFEAVAVDMDDAEEQANQLAGCEDLPHGKEKVLCTSIVHGYTDSKEKKWSLLDVGRNLNEELYR